MDSPFNGRQTEEQVEIAFIGDLTENESELSDKLLSVPRGGSCTLYFDSPGGSPYSAMSLMTLIALRNLQATGIVTGECSSAALWPFAACRRRIVTPHSVLLFHPMKWESQEHVALGEAKEWARHFGCLEQEMDQLLATMFGIALEKLTDWTEEGRYVTGAEIVDAGLAEMVQLSMLKLFQGNSTAAGKKKRKRVRAKAKA